MVVDRRGEGAASEPVYAVYIMLKGVKSFWKVCSQGVGLESGDQRRTWCGGCQLTGVGVKSRRVGCLTVLCF